MECEQCQKETGVLNTDVSTVDEIMLQDILIPARHSFFVSFYGLNSFGQQLPQFLQVMTFNFGAEIPGAVCGFILFYNA